MSEKELTELIEKLNFGDWNLVYPIRNFRI